MTVHKVQMSFSELRSKDGTVIASGPTGTMIIKLYARAKKLHAEVWWGDWFRVMKRRQDPQNLYMKCRANGEGVYITRDHV